MGKINVDINKIWERILKTAKNKFIEKNDLKTFDIFLSKSNIFKIDKNEVIVIVDSLVAKQVLSSQNYYQFLSNVVMDELESNYKLRFITIDESKKNIINKEEELLFKGLQLKPEMTFDNFVVGNSNKEAFYASLLVSSPSGESFRPNPLFLYSNSGLGKTHLLNSIGNAIKKNNQNKKIIITSGEDFFNEYFAAIRKNEQLYEYFKSVDILLIDDIQFLKDKDKCQTAFFSIFSSFINDNKQVVITSDKHPNELRGMEERLVTRFSGGLTISISTPEKETSIEIIKRFISTFGISISRFDESVINFLADKFSRNVRELKGVINKLIFNTIQINNIDKITLNDAINALNDDLKASDKNKKLNENMIIEAVSNYYSLPSSQILGNMRNSQIALARHIAMYLIRTILDTPFKKIGDIFGGKDHSTVMNAVKNVEKNMKTNPILGNTINDLKKNLEVPTNRNKK